MIKAINRLSIMARPSHQQLLGRMAVWGFKQPLSFLFSKVKKGKP
jgi:hypothetical protein